LQFFGILRRLDDHAECMLVLIGAIPEGKKELFGFRTGIREGAQSWRELLVDLKRRGFKIAPELAVGDGALGFWKALEELLPGTRQVLQVPVISPGEQLLTT
jgi:transposase-like protein